MLSYLFFIFAGALTFFSFHFIMGFRFKKHDEIRRKFAAFVADPRPLIVCANHQNFLDPILLIWAFGSYSTYIFNYRSMTWNLPASSYAQKSRLIKIFAYLTNCSFIERSAKHRSLASSFSFARQVLQSREVLTIFPEGHRSKSGRFEAENLKSGVKKIQTSVPDCRVLCVYLNSENSNAKGSFPPPRSRFILRMQMLNPESQGEIMDTIAKTILRMEKEHFSEG